MADWKPDNVMYFEGNKHNEAWFEGYEHDEAWMIVDGERACVWRKGAIPGDYVWRWNWANSQGSYGRIGIIYPQNKSMGATPPYYNFTSMKRGGNLLFVWRYEYVFWYGNVLYTSDGANWYSLPSQINGIAVNILHCKDVQPLKNAIVFTNNIGTYLISFAKNQNGKYDAVSMVPLSWGNYNVLGSINHSPDGRVFSDFMHVGKSDGVHTLSHRLLPDNTFGTGADIYYIYYDLYTAYNNEGKYFFIYRKETRYSGNYKVKDDEIFVKTSADLINWTSGRRLLGEGADKPVGIEAVLCTDKEFYIYALCNKVHGYYRATKEMVLTTPFIALPDNLLINGTYKLNILINSNKDVTGYTSIGYVAPRDFANETCMIKSGKMANPTGLLSKNSHYMYYLDNFTFSESTGNFAWTDNDSDVGNPESYPIIN